MTLADIEKESRLPNTREWLGFVTVFTFISAASDLGFPAASGFALLVLITFALTRGPEALEFITGKFNDQKAHKNKKKKTAAQEPELSTERSTRTEKA